MKSETDYAIKVANCFNSSLVDVSDADFSIALAEFNMSKNSYKTGDISTDENSSSPTINIYPNPAIEKLNIAANGDIQHIWLLNSIGQLVFETEANAPQIQLNVNDYKTDIYFVKIEVDGVIKTQKVFIK